MSSTDVIRYNELQATIWIYAFDIWRNDFYNEADHISWLYSNVY